LVATGGKDWQRGRPDSANGGLHSQYAADCICSHTIAWMEPWIAGAVVRWLAAKCVRLRRRLREAAARAHAGAGTNIGHGQDRVTAARAHSAFPTWLAGLRCVPVPGECFAVAGGRCWWGGRAADRWLALGKTEPELSKRGYSIYSIFKLQPAMQAEVAARNTQLRRAGTPRLYAELIPHTAPLHLATRPAVESRRGPRPLPPRACHHPLTASGAGRAAGGPRRRRRAG
jgi:hypothetical protein